MKTFKLKDLMVNIQPKQAELSEHYLTDCDDDNDISCSAPSGGCKKSTCSGRTDDCDDNNDISCSAPSGGCKKSTCSAHTDDDCDDDGTNSCSAPSSGVEEKLNFQDDFTSLDELKKAIAHLQGKSHAIMHAGETPSLN